ncbi:hypothetical protein MTR67_048090 [Solanum verrucosum]|uniref:Uncharacterized protein n=1 Tax=Solanum verrucosum TaxID=315347 RepID=A0AAF0UYZ1_SOLVR|nr:hypothetical protein MTR67_048090 [Solanum verrucosum]
MLVSRLSLEVALLLEKFPHGMCLLMIMKAYLRFLMTAIY